MATNYASRTIADYLDAHQPRILARLEQEMPADPRIPSGLLGQWLRNEAVYLRTGSSRAFEWMAAFLKYNIEKGDHPRYFFVALRRMRNTLLECCLTKIDGVPDAEIYRVLLQSEDHLMKHAGELLDEHAQRAATAETRYRRTIADSMHHAFVILDNEGVIQLANACFINLMGISEDRVTGQNFTALCSEDTAVELRRDLRQKRGTGSPSYEGQLRLPQGAAIEVRFWVAPIFDVRGLRNGLAVTIIRGDEAGATKLPYTGILETFGNALGIGVYVIDRALRVVSANDIAAAYVKIGAEDIKPHCCRQHLDASGKCADCFRKRPFETGMSARMTVQVENTAHENLWIEISALPLRNAQGVIAYTAKFVRNVTEQKIIENQFLQQQRTGLMTQLAVTVAHQLRNPLGVMIGFAELLSQGMPPEQVSTAIEKIFQNGIRCKEIVENLLEFGSAVRQDYVATDINTLVQERVQPRYAGRAADRIAWRFGVGLKSVECAPDQLVVVLLHLVDNAQAAGKQVVFETRPEEDGVMIRAWNDIPQPEWRGRQPESPETGDHDAGMELALNLSRRIIEEHGGRLYRDEEIADGACFVVRLPAAGGGEPLKDEPPEKQPPRQPERRVLIVEDNPDQLFMLSLALRGFGYHVDTAASGAEGIERIHHVSYDAIVIDVLLGDGLGGRDLYRILLQSNPELAQRALFITGDTMKYETRRFLNETNRPYLDKPFMIAEFTSEISRIASGEPCREK